MTPVVQFGTSRFLQAHALAFLASGQPTGPAPRVTVVQSTADPARRGRLAALGSYPVIVRGLENGARVERQETVAVVDRGLSMDADYDQIQRIFCEEARWIISNTADRGFDPQPADALPGPDPRQSYPAKLYHLLRARRRAGGGSLTILPTELVPRNGDTLRAHVTRIAAEQGEDPGIDTHFWVNSLVDRIVSEEIRPAGAVTEPYALWAIETQPGLVMPVHHPAISLVDDLAPIERLKLHILNLGHTVLVELWQAAGRREVYVREAMAGPLRAQLMDIMTREVLPGFAAQGMAAAADEYLTVTLSRFDNPFLDHALDAIAQNHTAKIAHRIAAFLDWSGQSAVAAPRLHAIAGGNAP